MYYLTVTAKRKGAKRHIVYKSNDLDDLIKSSSGINKKRYKVVIYSGKWKQVTEITE